MRGDRTVCVPIIARIVSQVGATQQIREGRLPWRSVPAQPSGIAPDRECDSGRPCAGGTTQDAPGFPSGRGFEHSPITSASDLGRAPPYPNSAPAQRAKGGRTQLMQVIDHTAGCRVIDIADALSITIGGTSTSKLVDRIQVAGWCQRQPNPEDGRSSVIDLTDEGKQLLDAAKTSFLDVLKRRLGAPIPNQSLQQFSATTRWLRDHLRAENKETPDHVANACSLVRPPRTRP